MSLRAKRSLESRDHGVTIGYGRITRHRTNERV
jgi:hypothetical protein